MVTHLDEFISWNNWSQLKYDNIKGSQVFRRGALRQELPQEGRVRHRHRPDRPRNGSHHCSGKKMQFTFHD